MRRCAFVVVLALMANLAFAQSYKLHSVYIYSFTRYVEWPGDYNQGDFEILVLGETPMLDALKDLVNSKKVGDRNIKVTKISSASEIRKCNMLFLPADQSAQLTTVLAKTANQSTLLITEGAGMGLKGSDINFITKDGKLAFELNQAAASKHNLKVSNTLMGMAILI